MNNLFSRQLSLNEAKAMSVYQCPICGNELHEEKKRYICQKNHSFDISKEGYVNLLPSNHKKSKNPGDNKHMIRSRRDFLELGYYDPISQTLNKTIKPLLIQNDNLHPLLDVGCGEGFFLWKLRKALSDEDSQANTAFYGIDISKPAIRYAAKRDQTSHFAVGSIYHLPIRDESITCVTRIFAPKSYTEFSRVLMPSGVLITIVPNSEHLMSLKRFIYEKPKAHTQSDDSELDEFFILREKKHINYTISIVGHDAILKLISMTPYHWSISKTASDALAELSELEVEIDCLLNVYEKRSDKG